MKKPDIQRTYYKNGRPYQEVPFVGGKINGIIREWHRSGALAREVPIRDGQRHGVCKQWNNKGELLGTFEMDMGRGISKQWYPNGQLEFEASVINETFTGRFRHWNEHGQLTAENFFLNNKRVSKAEYDRAQESNPDLPAYAEADETHPKHTKRNGRHEGPERLIRRLLSTRKAEAREWLHASTSASRKLLDELSTKNSAALVEDLYTAGAAKVLAADIDEDMKGNQTADKLVVALPTNARQREAIRELCAYKKLVFSPEHETGQSHLAILFG
jgi:antitoxin component YwqK of YwqJK toxin-antitoxin module